MRVAALMLIASVAETGGCATHPDPRRNAEVNTAVEPPASVEADYSSWGKPISHWRLDADGSAELWKLREGKDFHIYHIDRFHARLPAEHKAAFDRAFATFASGKARQPECKDIVTDAPSLTVRWTGGAIHLDYGCIDKASQAYAGRLGAALSIVGKNLVVEPTPFASEYHGPPKSP